MPPRAELDGAEHASASPLSGPRCSARRRRARSAPTYSSEDALAAERLTTLLADLAFHVESYRIPPDGKWQPPAETVAICGPKSSEVTAAAITTDPYLTFEPDAADVWTIRDRDTGQVFESPTDQPTPDLNRDIAYLARLGRPGTAETMLVIAGVHSIGSVGAVDFLAHNLPELYEQVGTRRFSMVVASTHDGDAVTRSEQLCPPRVHE